MAWPLTGGCVCAFIANCIAVHADTSSAAARDSGSVTTHDIGLLLLGWSDPATGPRRRRYLGTTDSAYASPRSVHQVLGASRSGGKSAVTRSERICHRFRTATVNGTSPPPPITYRQGAVVIAQINCGHPANFVRRGTVSQCFRSALDHEAYPGAAVPEAIWARHIDHTKNPARGHMWPPRAPRSTSFRPRPR